MFHPVSDFLSYNSELKNINKVHYLIGCFARQLQCVHRTLCNQYNTLEITEKLLSSNTTNTIQCYLASRIILTLSLMNNFSNKFE